METPPPINMVRHCHDGGEFLKSSSTRGRDPCRIIYRIADIDTLGIRLPRLSCTSKALTPAAMALRPQHGSVVWLLVAGLVVCRALTISRLSLGNGVLQKARRDGAARLETGSFGPVQRIVAFSGAAEPEYLQSLEGCELVDSSDPAEALEAVKREATGGIWLHVACVFPEIVAARRLGARTIWLDPTASDDGDLDLEGMGFVAVGIVDDFSDAVCASVSSLAEAVVEVIGVVEKEEAEAAADVDAPLAYASDESSPRPSQGATTELSPPTRLEAAADTAPRSEAPSGPAAPATGRVLEVMDVVEAMEAAQTKFCVQCGAPDLPRSARFCFECGAPQPEASRGAPRQRDEQR